MGGEPGRGCTNYNLDMTKVIQNIKKTSKGVQTGLDLVDTKDFCPGVVIGNLAPGGLKETGACSITSVPSFSSDSLLNLPEFPPFRGDPSPSFSDPVLDTLQQLTTKEQLAQTTGLRKRSIKRFLAQKIALELVDIHSTLEKAYWTTYYCNSELYQEGQKITGHYCGKRWCPVCISIKIAKLIKGYGPVVEKFKDPHYVVLTVPNVPGHELRFTFEEFQHVFRKMNDNFKRRHDVKLQMIRTIESTYNKKTDLYHPHVNIIVDGSENAELIVDDWLRYYPDADRAAQYNKPADGNSIKELFKYVAKQDEKTPAKSLDVIYRALHKMRICQATGVKKVSEETEDIQSELYNVKPFNARWYWDQDLRDWYQPPYYPGRCKQGLCALVDKGWISIYPKRYGKVKGKAAES